MANKFNEENFLMSEVDSTAVLVLDDVVDLGELLEGLLHVCLPLHNTCNEWTPLYLANIRFVSK